MHAAEWSKCSLCIWHSGCLYFRNMFKCNFVSHVWRKYLSSVIFARFPTSPWVLCWRCSMCNALSEFSVLHFLMKLQCCCMNCFVHNNETWSSLVQCCFNISILYFNCGLSFITVVSPRSNTLDFFFYRSLLLNTVAYSLLTVLT